MHKGKNPDGLSKKSLVDSCEYLAEDFGRTHGAHGGIVEAEVAQGSVENGVALSV